MDPAEEIVVPQREKKPRADDDGEARPISVSKVLDDDDLLAEILLRVGFPTALVRAAAVCTRWLHQVSGRGFLRRFRELHPPRLLGFYVDAGINSPETRLPRFVPMLPQAPAELAAVVRRASSSFDAYQSDNSTTRIIDCRNGSALVKVRKDGGRSTVGVHNLLCHERGMAVVPRFPRLGMQHSDSFVRCEVLSKEEQEEGRLSYFYVLIQPTMKMRSRKSTVLIYVLQDGVWHVHHSFSTEHILDPCLGRKYVLVDNKIYMLVVGSNIIVLGLTASTFSTIHLPQGVEYTGRNAILSRNDDAAGVYLIHVKQLLLHIWLHRGDDWLLVDTFRLFEMCGDLNMLDCKASLEINQVGDNAEFVFLEMGQWVLYLDIKRRTLRIVYEIQGWKPWDVLGDIYPFMMIWPPTFPTLKHDPARNAM